MAEEMNTSTISATTTATSTGGTVTIPYPAVSGTQAQAAAPEIDYDKLSSILDGKLKVTEESVLKGYFKQQGLTGDEMSEAIEKFKADKASKAPDIDALNQRIAGLDEELLLANSERLYAEAQFEAIMMAAEIGVEQKTVPYLLKMADISDVITDGRVDQEKLKESLGAVLKDIPQLKIAQEGGAKSGGFKIGADTSKQTNGTNEELARIFGVSKKK